MSESVCTKVTRGFQSHKVIELTQADHINKHIAK